MKRESRRRVNVSMRLFLLYVALSAVTFAQHLVVTAEGHGGSHPPELMKDDVSVEVNKRPARVEGWVPLRGEEGKLELFIVIDDGDDPDLGAQFSSLKAFIGSQPASTRIGLAYLRNGAADIVAPLTADRAQTANALRIPMGQPGIAASPFMGVSDLIKKWAAADARREMLLLSSGIDPWSPADPRNPYLQEAIKQSQRAGILVHSIYYGSAGHAGHSYWQSGWGQNYLSELGDETGGEAYWQGNRSPVSIEPYLKDLAQRLNNQYLLTVGAGDSKGDLQPIRVSTPKSGVSLVTASQINFRK